mmetsp:Transcript_24656/g.48367  ORF Transcript_24656/g.48367 Transcript_24656/m.48367 type:complete len:84 (-) Transcript_24656:66-317(-)
MQIDRHFGGGLDPGAEQSAKMLELVQQTWGDLKPPGDILRDLEMWKMGGVCCNGVTKRFREKDERSRKQSIMSWLNEGDSDSD